MLAGGVRRATAGGGPKPAATTKGWLLMADAPAGLPRAGLDDPFAVLAGPLAGTSRLALTVTGSAPLTPHMHRLRLTAPGLGELRYAPGQDMMLMVGVDGNRPVRRRYTIRDLDPASRTVTLDVVRHGEGPGERWVSEARPGDPIEGIAPRGKVTTAPDADWHLFAGDESALPAIFRMAESLPAGQTAVILLEIPGPEDEQPLATKAGLDLRWLPRHGGPAGQAEALAAAAADVPLPAGHGHAYLLGEARVVSRLRDVMADRGLAASQVSPKAYWGRGRANASHGEPAKDS
jgi:NADPH-dependent ferric siderophore reductase